MIRVALVEPEIPPNTGNVARLCAAATVPLHIVGVTGFRMDDRAVRAGPGWIIGRKWCSKDIPTSSISMNHYLTLGSCI